jgi:hypothetical protein
MLKNILSLEGAKELKKDIQLEINGGNEPGNTGCPNNPRGMCPIGFSFDCSICECLPDGIG